MDPELEYLQLGFDPNSLTMAKIRGILVAHNVPYPASAKKSQLVDIFNDKIASQAAKLLGAQSRIKRSARGIEDVPSSAEPSQDGEASDEVVRPARTPRRSTKHAPRTSALEEEEDVTETATAHTRSARQSTSKPNRISRVEETPATARKASSGGKKTRLSSTTPTVKLEEPEYESYEPDRRESAFSSENVFQSGSSPLLEAQSTGRRRTTGASETKERKGSTSRRKTDGTVAETSTNGRISSPTRRTRTPSSRHSRIIKEEELEQDAGEEFTPEETQDLVRAQQSGSVATPVRKRSARKQRSTIVTLAPIAITLAMLGGLGTVWREEKLAVGFCGVGKAPAATLGGVEIPQWARDTFQPQCEPCPPHAYCFSDLKISCEDDFMLVSHPLSLGGVVPLPPTCEPDGEKARKVQAVADRAVEELRERNAKFECGELKDESTGKRAETSEIKEPELKASVSAKRRKGMSDQEFEELWHSALGELMDRDEIIGDTDSSSTTGTRTLRSTSLARIPLSCALRRSIRLALVRHLKQLILFLITIGLLGYAYITFSSSREMETRAKQLASFALERLAQQAAWANYYGDENVVGQDGTSEGRVERYIGVPQLRDDVLRDEFSAKRRQKLWDRVQRKVEDNANVRSAVREGRNGEVGRVWEWIGAVKNLDWDPSTTASGASRRSSGRMSLPAPYIGSSPLAGVNTSIVGRGGQARDLSEFSTSAQWDEGRPIY